MHYILITNESKQTSVQLNQSPVSYTQAVQLLALYTEKGFEEAKIIEQNA